MADTSGTANTPKPTSSVKLVLLGEAAVGKSSLVLRFVNNDFQENKEPTIGAAFLTQKCNLPTRTIKFEIWDTAGQERFASLAPMYYRNAQAALVAYDLTKASSLVKARHWVAELQRQANPNIVIALVGNKLDLVDGDDADPDGASSGPSGSAEEEASGDGDGEATAGGADERQRKVSTKEAEEFAKESELLFYETSAKTGAYVNDVFTAIAKKIPETALKSARGAPGTGGGAAGTAGNRGAGTGAGRVELGRTSDNAGAKEGCAC